MISFYVKLELFIFVLCFHVMIQIVIFHQFNSSQVIGMQHQLKTGSVKVFQENWICIFVLIQQIFPIWFWELLFLTLLLTKLQFQNQPSNFHFKWDQTRLQIQQFLSDNCKLIAITSIYIFDLTLKSILIYSKSLRISIIFTMDIFV